MKKVNIKIILNFLFILLSFTACEEYIEYEIKETERKIVVNGLITPNEEIRIHISRSMSSADRDISLEYPKDATVQLYEDDLLVSTLQYDTLGVFTSNYYPKINKSYTITVNTPSIKNISTKTILNETSEITDFNADNLLIESYSYDDGNGNTYSDYSISGIVSVTIDKQKQSNSYYIIELQKKYHTTHYNYITNENKDTIVTENMYYYPNSTNEQYSEYIYIANKLDGYIFSTEYNNSETITYNLSVDSYYNGYNSMAIKKIYVNVYYCSRDIYLYAQTFNTYRDNNGNPFTEPVNIFSNVENGLGLFSGYTITKDSVDFKIK